MFVKVVGGFSSHRGYFFLSQRIFLSLTEDIFFSHRTHRFDRTYLRTVSIPQKASGIQNTQNVTAKVGCKVL